MNQPVENPVKFLRLNTGEDIISEVIPYLKDDQVLYYILKNPCKIVYLIGENEDSIMISLIEWVYSRISNNQTFNLGYNNVLIISEATVDLSKYYYEYLDKSKSNKVSMVKDSVIELEESDDEDEEVQVLKKVLHDLKLNNNKRKLH